MIKVENKKTLKQLTARFMSVNRGRNVIAIVAIFLTTLLFTSVLTASFSMIKSTRDSEIRQEMDSSHTILQNLTKEEYKSAIEVVENSKDVKRYGTGTFLGLAVNPELQAFQTEVRYGDKNLSESFQCQPEEGRLPESKDEIACSTIVLDAFQIPHQLGEMVTINLEIKGKIYKDTFRLVGFWEGDRAVMAQIVWLSEDYRDQNAYGITKEEVENGIYEGGYDIVVWYHNLWNLTEKTQRLNQEIGMKNQSLSFQINPAYLLFEEDGFSFQALFLMMLIIMLTGYLIIYNIFQISVQADIRTYGLLKNIGTSGKQLKKIVRMQAWRLSIIGIPIGLVVGYMAGCVMMPSLMADGEGSQEAKLLRVSTSPLIFLAATFFAFITVYISCLLPCKKVAKVSPVEAIKLAETEKINRTKKKNCKVSPFGMAIENMRRTWKKGLIVMLSISLSLITLNSVIVLTKGFQFKEYVRLQINSDFAVSQVTSNLRSSNLESITPEIREILDQCSDIQSNGYLYCSSIQNAMDPILYKNSQKIYKKMREYILPNQRKEWKENLKRRTIKVHLMGVNKGIFEKLEFRKEKASWDEFKTGNYVIVDYPRYLEEESYYNKNDSVTVQYSEKISKQYQVISEAQLPYPLDYPFYDGNYITMIVPDSEYLSYMENQNAMVAAIDVKEGKDLAVAEYIQTFVNQNQNFCVISLMELRQDFQAFLNKYYLIGGTMAGILALIGIMNFFNTSATSILSRKRELSLLEIVGMTKKQLQKMLVMEGMFYLFGGFLLAVFVILTATEKILSSTVGLAWYFHLHVTITPCLWIFPILCFIACIIPVYNFKRMNQETVVERVRENY